MSDVGEVARYSYLILAAFFIASVVNYLYQVVMGILLPRSDFGSLGVALSVLYIASVVTQNTFSWPATKFIAVNPENGARYFRTALVGNLILALAASFLIIHFGQIMLLVAASLLLTAIVNSYVSALRGFKMFLPIAVANTANPVVKILVAAALVIAGYGVLGALAGLVAAVAFSAAYLAIVARKIEFGKSSGWSFKMVRESASMSVTFLGIFFLVNGSIVMLKLSGFSDVVAGSFNAALTVSRAVFFLASALITVTFPYVSSESMGERLSFESLKYVILFAFPIALSMSSNPEAWLTVFFSNKYVDAGIFLRYLGLGVGFLSISTILASNLLALGKSRFTALSVAMAGIAYAVVSYSSDTLKISAFLLLVSVTLTIALTIYYAKNYYFKAGLTRITKLLCCYAVLSLLMTLRVEGRVVNLALIAAALLTYTILISITGLFDDRDVEFLLAPLPKTVRERAAVIVTKLNSLLR
ncbi:oligosaccharide flippase family protein [Archaeoglobus neptunius]|uniref:oligosaccharide flippase family protein n=1 Tax=Archaeoglobus neptunius TaxID=2798580 RepID=UPI001927E14B